MVKIVGVLTICFFSFSVYRCPDAVSFKTKPIIGGTYQTLKEKLSGLGKDIQAVDTSDLDYAVVAKQLA